MATFEEMMEKFRNPGDDGLPATFADELATAHTEELSLRDAAIAARENAAAELQAKLDAATTEQLRLKAVNYDLLMAAPKPGEQPDNQDKGSDNDGDKPRGIASLFTKENN